MVYQHALFLILFHKCFIGFLMPGCINHAVARWFLQNFHSHRGHFHAEWVWARARMMRCWEFNVFLYISLASVASLQDSVVECTLARGKSVILNMAKENLDVIEVLPRRPRWVWDDSLGKTRRFWEATGRDNPLLAGWAVTMEGIKGRYYEFIC